MAIHVFFDNSNVWGGAQLTMKLREPGGHWAVLRQDCIKLLSLVEGGRARATGIFAASEGANTNWIYAIAKACGYEPLVMKRVRTPDGRSAEQGVDELMHLRICMAILDYKSPQTLVIVSGDGQTSDFGTSFPEQVRRALNHGWDVEIWSWDGVLDRPVYEKMPEYGSPRLKIETLDQYYYQVTTLDSGTVFDKDDLGNQINVRFVKARPARP